MNKQTATVEPPPPGENGTELTGGDALASMHESLLALTTSAGLKLDVNEMHIRRFNGRAIVFVGFTNGQSVTLRIAAKRVADLRDRLNVFLAQGPNGTDARKALRK